MNETKVAENVADYFVQRATFGRSLACLLIGSLAVIAHAPEARADICCNCSSASISASPGNVDLNQPVTITYNASYCRCVGGPCWHPEGNCSLPPVNVQIFLEGGGQVSSQSISFPPSNDFNVPLSQGFSYTPTEAGVYTVVAAGTCPSASATFTAGCVKDCQNIAACETCGAGPTPQITSNKSDDTIITECECPEEEGEMVTVTVNSSGDTPDCYELEIMNDESVEIIDKPADSGSWPGSLTIKLQGKEGTGSVTVNVTLHKFDDTNQCWMDGMDSLTLQAKPSDECEVPCCTDGGRGTRGAGSLAGASPVLGTMRLAGIELDIRAGAGDLLRLPKINSVHSNGDVEVTLPGTANARVIEAGSALRGWVMGGGPLRANEYVQISNTREGLTYRFEPTNGGTYPFRLQKIRRFDFTTHSSYVYDAGGKLIEIHAGASTSDTYLALSYDVGGNLTTILPYVGGAPDSDRSVTILYDSGMAIGLSGAICTECEGAQKRYYYNAQGLVSRITDLADNDLELFTYNAEGFLTQRQKLNSLGVMVVVETRTYGANQVTIHERVSDSQERIRVEQYDAVGRLVRVDKYTNLFPHDSVPSGEALTTTHTRSSQQDASAGIRADIKETTDAGGVTKVSVTKTFENGAPAFLPIGSDNNGWRLPLDSSNNVFDLSGFQDGDAVLSPIFAGATAIGTLEVAATGTYHVKALVHDDANPGPGEKMCVRFSISGGGMSLADGYVARNSGDPPPVDPWLPMYRTSCALYGQSGQEHAGWSLQTGVTYTVTMTVMELSASPNPIDGFGIDGIALTRFPMADPDGFPEAPYRRIEGAAKYDRSYTRGSGGGATESDITFHSFQDSIGEYLTSYRIDANGGKTEFEYDIDGLLISETGPAVTLLDGGGTVQSVHTFEYNVNKQLVREGRSDAGGGLTYTDYTYDVYGRRTSTTDNAAGPPSEQSQTLSGYSIYDELISTTDACGGVSGTIYDNTGRVTDEVVYEAGPGGNLLKQTHFDYDANNRLTRRRVALHNGPFALNAPSAWSDTTYIFDQQGRQLSETTPGPGGGGLTTTLGYDYQEQVSSRTQPDGSVSSMVRDGLGRTVQQTLSAPGITPLTTLTTYNAQGRLSGMTSATGSANTFEYDQFGRQSATTEGGVRRTDKYYDASGRIVRMLITSLPGGSSLSDTTFEYDALGRPIRTRQRLAAGVDGPSDPVQLTVYDIKGRVAAVVDKADGNVDLDAYEPGDARTRSIYNGLNRVVQEIDAAGTITELAYDACGGLISESIDPAGLDLTATFEYDAAGRTTRSTDPEGHYFTSQYNSQDKLIREYAYNSGSVALWQTRWSYDSSGRLLQSAGMLDAASAAAVDSAVDAVADYTYYTDGNAGAGQIATRTFYDGAAALTTTYAYDGVGRSLRTSQPLAPAQNYEDLEYDSATGRIAARVVSDPLGVRRFEMSYDAANRITLRRVAGGGGEPNLDTQVQYDGLGRKTLETAPDGTQRVWTYDLLGRLTQQIDDAAGVARTTVRTYDRIGRLATVTANDGAQNQVTSYFYDAAGRLTLIRFADHNLDGQTGEVTLAYDAAGRTTTRTDQRGIVNQYEYDGRDLLTRKQATSLGIDYTYAYDGLGRMTMHQRDANNRAVITYNALDQVVSEVQTVAGVSKTIAYGYNQTGKVTAMTYPAELATALAFEYDALGNNTLISRNAAPLVEYTYQGRFMTNRRLRTDQGAMLDRAAAYDHHRRITSLASTVGASNLATYLFDHDAMGNYSYNHGSSDVFTAWSADYLYDSLQRVVQADYMGGVTGAEAFTYDLLGNLSRYCPRSCDVMTPTDGVFYDHNAANEYTQITEAGVPVAVKHDAAGNLVRDEGGYGFSYDAENLLTRIFSDTDGDGEYDALEPIHAEYVYDAIGRRIETTIDSVTLRYYFDERNELAEYSPSDMNTAVRWYVSGTNEIDERAVMYTNDPAAGGPGADYYYVLGHLDSVTGIADDQGQLVEHVAYDVYGKPTITRPGGVNAGNGYYYTGRRLDQVNSGQLAIQYNLARYFSPDRARWYSRDPLGAIDSNNLYEYTRSNPIRGTDPAGFGTYTKGPCTRPSFTYDNGFPYDPNASASWSDHINWAEWGIKLAGAEALGYLPDGTAAYRHYRDGGGADFHIDYDKYYREDSYGKGAIDNEIISAQEAAERLWNGKDKETFEMTGSGVGLRNGTTENWQKAIGAHNIYGCASVTVEPCSEDCEKDHAMFTMEITINAEDRYNFNRGQADIATGAPDNENGRFETLGWAHSFMTYGSLSRTVTWCEGDISGTTDVSGEGRRGAGGRRDRGRGRDRGEGGRR